MSIESVMPSNHLILCRPLLLLPSVFPSIRVFSNESVLNIRWPKHWSFGFSIHSSNDYSGLISFRVDWFDLLEVQYVHTYTRVCVCAKSLHSCPTLCDSMDCSPPCSFVHGILQERILEWVAMPSSRESSQPRD